MTITVAAGQRLTADVFNAILPKYVDKSAGTQSVTSSTTYVDDTALFLDLPAGRTYVIFCQLSVTGDTAGDFKVQWSTTGTLSTVVERANRGPSIGTTDVSGAAAAAATVCVNRASSSVSLTASSTSYGLEGAAGVASDVVEQFVISTGASGGRLQLRWAQRASSATATVLGVDSFLMATPVS